MSGALDELSELNMELLRRNKFCMGKKRGKKYVCNGNADENAVNKAVELLSEAVRRVWRWRAWETWWIKEHADEWLEKHDKLEIQLRGKYSDDVVNDLLRMVNKFIDYNEQFLNYWHEVGNEVKELIENLMNGGAEVVIRGEDVSGISVYSEHITLEVDRARTGSITVQLSLDGLEGVTIEVPDVFRRTMSEEEYAKFVNDVLRALEGGFEETDGTIVDGKAAMSTTQIWQVVVWALLYPGENYVHISAVNINEGGVTTKWHLRSSHDPLKGKIFNDADKLSEVGILAFTFTAVLGDGWADVVKVVINGRAYDEAVVKITMSDEKLDRWESLLERLKGMGFNWKPVPTNDGVIDVRFHGSNAIDLARAMINALPPILKEIFDALAFEKWERMKRIAEMEMRWRRGEMQIIVAGYKFTVDIQKGTVVLVHPVRTENEAKNVIEALKTVYGDEFHTRVNSHGKRLAVKIPMHVCKRYSDIKEQVIRVLCRKYERTKDERKRQEIIKTLRRLTPTKGVATV